MGGLETDLHGRTSLPGLFAAGEVACTRVHGANRLASNSLLVGLVFGARAGLAMQRALTPAGLPAPEFRAINLNGGPPAPVGALSETAIRDLMWQSVGLFRDGDGLRHAARLLEIAHRKLQETLTTDASIDLDGWRRANLLTVARLIARAALRRQESRGAHFRSDCPARDDLDWKIHVTDVNDAQAERLGRID
jgi:L-aspartate oxidase